MDRLFDRLGDLLRDVLGGGGSGAHGRRGRTRQFDDPDLAAAWEELENFLNADEDETAAGTARRGPDAAGGGAAAAPPPEHLRADYATLEVAFGTPLAEVRRSYKRLMRAHHPDRFATDPDRLAAATRKAAQINAAYARIDRADRASRQ